ncbi:MAG: hypothetical protein ACYDCC_11290 [Actinomycetota bacterium]
MKSFGRIMAAGILGLICVSGAGQSAVAAPSAVLNKFNSAFGSWSNGSFGGYIRTQTDLVSGSTTTRQDSDFCVSVTVESSSDSGCGLVTISADPAALQGSITGSVPSVGSGFILVNLSYMATDFYTGHPGAQIHLDQGPPASAGLATFNGTGGTWQGSISSTSIGTVTLTGVQGYLNSEFGPEVSN